MIIILILIVILIQARHHALLLDHRPRMHDHNKKPQRHQQDRHDARHPLDGRTEQLLADLNQCDREAHVGEHHGVPDAFEGHLLDGLEGRDQCYAEEPEAEGPEETVGWG